MCFWEEIIVGKLYRGVSFILDNQNKGKILPRGTKQEVTMKVGDKGLKFDGKFQFGPTKNNTARSHQLESGMHGGAGISTTRSFEQAKKFATYNGMEDGYIYEINEDLLSEHGVEKFEFFDSEYPHEHEVTLITKDGGELPSEVIMGKHEIKLLYDT
jgi:hypothetical protein